MSLTPEEREKLIEELCANAAFWKQGGGIFTPANIGDLLERAAEALASEESDAEQYALEVLCRVFDDGADVRYPKWRAWYKPGAWLHPARALGAFIRQELDASRPFKHDCETWRMEGIGCADCNPVARDLAGASRPTVEQIKGVLRKYPRNNAPIVMCIQDIAGFLASELGATQEKAP